MSQHKRDISHIFLSKYVNQSSNFSNLYFVTSPFSSLLQVLQWFLPCRLTDRRADCINKHLFSKFYESPLFSFLNGYQFSTAFPFKRNPVYKLLLYAPFTHLPVNWDEFPPYSIHTFSPFLLVLIIFCFKVVEDLATTASSNLTSPRVNLTFEPINPQQNLAEGGVFESIKNSLQSLRVIDLVFCSYNNNNNNNNDKVTHCGIQKSAVLSRSGRASKLKMQQTSSWARQLWWRTSRLGPRTFSLVWGSFTKVCRTRVKVN